MNAGYLVQALVVFLAFALPARAEYVEIRRVVDIYAEPTRDSEILDTVGPTDEEPLVVLYLDEENPREGNYLRVRLPSYDGEIGYVYKTAGRVYKDHSGKYEPYDRRKYRHWTDDNRDCIDTRGEVLLRDDISGTAKPVRSGSGNKCRITGGQWIDPYTGSKISNAKEIDIDHLVPLKNAHESGAWSWSAERKREYANYLDNNYHLIAASAAENRRKGDKGPEGYLPPASEIRCEYVQNWIAVKREWGLRLPAAEKNTVEDILTSCP